VRAPIEGSETGEMVGETGDERERIMKALEACGGNQTRAAKMLGIGRRTLTAKLTKYNMPRPRK
jgi:DNA-binding protein Fis